MSSQFSECKANTPGHVSNICNAIVLARMARDRIPVAECAVGMHLQFPECNANFIRQTSTICNVVIAVSTHGHNSTVTTMDVI